MPTRDDLRAISRLRLSEAKTLYRAGLYAGAYNLAGLAVECALKAVIARGAARYVFPDKKFANECHVHGLEALRKLAKIDLSLAPPQVLLNWAVVKDWDVNARYDIALDQKKAIDVYVAVTNRRHGVMPWVRQYW